jgi:hypothetical protein
MSLSQIFGFLPAFDEMRQLEYFLALLSMQMGRADGTPLLGKTSSALRVSVAIFTASPKVAKNQ